MEYPQVVDALRSYWPGAEQAPQGLLHLSLTEAYHGARRVIDRNGAQVLVNIAPGIHTGAKIYLPRTGRERSRVADYCTVVVHNQPPFVRDGDDLVLKHSIEIRTIILGGQVTVPALDGQAVLTVPAWTAPGSTLRLPGRGMPIHGRPGEFGDLCVHLVVRVPANASPLERRIVDDIVGLQHWRLGHSGE